jgi:sugar lactone lactonase YvrE
MYTISTFAGGALPVNISGLSAGLSPGYVAADPAGNLFFVNQNTVLRLDAATGILTRVAGSGATGFSGDHGPATSAQFYFPTGIAVDSVGNIYIADTDNNRIRMVANGVITTVAGNGFVGFSGDNGPATGARLANPQGVAVDSAGNLYIADTGNSCIRKVSNGVITTLAGNGLAGFSGDNGPATNAQLSGPISVAVDSSGNLYIPDNDRIRKVASGMITTVAGNGTQGFSGDNGPATSAQLTDPEGIAVDSAGNLYIADGDNNRIRKVASGVITTVAGNGLAGFGGDNGAAVNAQLNFPHGVAIDSAGNLYIVDTENQRIRKVSNGVITTVAGGGTLVGGNGPATSAQLSDPRGVAVDSAGNLYFSDSNRIWEVSNGVITAVAGNGTAGSSGDNGPATSAQLYFPAGIAVDSAGTLYIAET